MSKQSRLFDYFKTMSNKSTFQSTSKTDKTSSMGSTCSSGNERVKYALPRTISLLTSDSDSDFEPEKQTITKTKKLPIETENNVDTVEKKKKTPAKRKKVLRKKKDSSESSPSKRIRKESKTTGKQARQPNKPNKYMMKLNSPKKVQPINNTINSTIINEKDSSQEIVLNSESISSNLNITENDSQETNMETVTSVISKETIVTSSETFVDDDYIVTKSSLNMSQTSSATEEYDTTEYESEILQCESISTSQQSDNPEPTNRQTRSYVSRELFGAKQSTAQVKNRKLQTEKSLLSQFVEFAQNNAGENQSRNKNTILNGLVDGLVKVVATEVSKNLTELTKKPTTPQKNKPKENETFIKIDASPKSKPTGRYSEDSHQRLCGNVHKIGKWVIERFENVLHVDSVRLFNTLVDLNDLSHQAFCLRLYTRQNKFHNFNDICSILKLNEDKEEANKMLKVLVEHNLIETDYSNESPSYLLNLLPVNQIKQLCSASKLKKTPTKKEGMITALVNSASKQMTLSSSKTSDDILKDRIKAKLGTCVRLAPMLRDMLDKVHLLYTLASPDLETANDIYKVLNEMHFNKVKYPNVTIDKVRIFDTCQEFTRFIEARVLRKEFYEELLNKNKEKCNFICEKAFEKFNTLLHDEEQKQLDKKKPLFLRRYSPSWIYCSIVSSGALNLGKDYPRVVCKWLKYLLNQKLYCSNKRGQWYAQLALVYQSHLKDLVTAIEHITTGLSDVLVDEVNKYELSIRGSKINKNKISTELFENLQEVLLPVNDMFPTRLFQANIVHDNLPGRKKSYIRTTDEGREYGSVEETAISFYIDDGVYTQGIHCEGSLLTQLFYLLFWDIIYSVHVPNTFISSIQRYPLDMYSGEFYKNRSTQIDDRLNEIENLWTEDDLREFLEDVLRERATELDVLISTDVRDVDFLCLVAECIGKDVLAAVCRRFVENFRLFRSGLPDLFLWNPEEKKCCFVEVKGEKDKLSSKQILWLHYLQKHGAKIEMCHIQDIGSRSVKKIYLQANYDSQSQFC